MDQEPRREALTYLETHNTLTVATIGPDGPWAAALFYVNDGFDLYWLSDPQTRHSRNIARNRRVAVTIQEDYRDWRVIRGIQMEGTVEEVGSLTDALGPMGLYAAKYPFLGDWQKPLPSLARALGVARMYRFRPTQVLFIDNTKGFGHRQEVAIVP
jgi:uncharacterized protein YhbP (UPF0306 family)